MQVKQMPELPLIAPIMEVFEPSQLAALVRATHVLIYKQKEPSAQRASEAPQHGDWPTISVR